MQHAPFFLGSISKSFLAEALDPDKRITADDDWHLEQCKAKQEKTQMTEIGDDHM